jgi:isftu1 transposase
VPLKDANHIETGSKRLNIVAGLLNGKLLAPTFITKNFNTDYMLKWLPKLLAESGAGYSIVMDNAPFHRNIKIKALIEEAGCEMLRLPPYSPDLNPIENYWHVLKTKVKKERQGGNDLVASVFNSVENIIELI